MPTEEKRMLCAVKDCNNEIHSRGWCQKHYARWRKHGDVNFVFSNLKKKRICSLDWCEKDHYANGLCSTHNARKKRGIDLSLPIAKGRKNNRYNAKVTTTEVAQIRDLHASGVFTRKEIAVMYGLKLSGVKSIVARETWKEVE